MKTELWLSLKYLQKHRKTPAFFLSVIATLGIALGVAALILVISVMSGFDQEVKSKLLGFNYHMVASFDTVGPEQVKHMSEEFGVTSAVKYAEMQTAIRYNKQIAPVMLYAIDYTKTEKERWGKFLLRGDLTGVVIGSIMQRRLGISLGDAIELFNPVTTKLDTFTVSGIFEVGLYDADDMVIAMPADANPAYAGALKDNWSVGVRLNDPDSAQDLKADMLETHTEGMNYITTWIDRNKTLFTWLKLEKLGSYIVLSLIVLVASFNIFATQSIRVVEKTKDIGILKTIGFDNGNIGTMFCLQGMVLGTLGTFFGLVLGLAMCYVVGYTNLIPLPAELYHIDHIPVLFDMFDISVICGIALALSFVFSLFPALKAASMKVSDALGYE
jgi:lipoprotein-releasing system permease protein